ncbi:hypothetical protein GCM10009806_22280 [Microbacterium flavum]
MIQYEMPDRIAATGSTATGSMIDLPSRWKKFIRPLRGRVGRDVFPPEKTVVPFGADIQVPLRNVDPTYTVVAVARLGDGSAGTEKPPTNRGLLWT